MKNKGEERKMIQIYNNYKNTMIYLANSILKNYHNALDIVSDATIIIMNNLDKINEIDSNETKGFIDIIVRNLSYNFIKRNKTLIMQNIDEIECTIFDNNISIEDDFISKYNYQKILDCISEQHENYKDILRLRYIFDLKDKEIADLLSLSDNATRTRLHRARQALIRELKKEGITNG